MLDVIDRLKERFTGKSKQGLEHGVECCESGIVVGDVSKGASPVSKEQIPAATGGQPILDYAPKE